MKTPKEKFIWLIASLLCLILYILSEKPIELLIWMGVSLIMFRLAMIDEQIDNKFKT